MSRGDAEADTRFLRRTARVLRLIVLALLAAYVLRVFLYEPFHIPSGSMNPTLVRGDYVLASKFAYGYSRVSAAPVTLNFIKGRTRDVMPERGDVIVFRNAKDAGRDYVKRVIALPGERVRMKRGAVKIDGRALPLADLGTVKTVTDTGAPVIARRWRETLPSGRSYVIQHYEGPNGEQTGPDDTYEMAVPPGHVFVLGDNRDASIDSRFPDLVGVVPVEDIVGRADEVLVSTGEAFRARDPSSWASLRPDRILVAVGVEG